MGVHKAGVGVCGKGSGLWHGLGHVAGKVYMVGCGGMWQGVGAWGRVWGHVAGGGGMWYGVRPMA